MSGLEIAAGLAVAVTPFVALGTMPFWYDPVAPYILRHCGKIHPAADLCVRLLDMRLDWQGNWYRLNHNGGALLRGSNYSKTIQHLEIDGAEIPLNAASKAALTIAARRYFRAEARHSEIHAASVADKAVSAFAHKIADMYDPDKVVPIKRRAS